MALCLRYINKKGEVTECFLGIVYVSDTTSLTLKKMQLSHCLWSILEVFLKFEAKVTMGLAICKVRSMPSKL